jgi:hypothetical protein
MPGSPANRGREAEKELRIAAAASRRWRKTAGWGAALATAASKMRRSVARALSSAQAALMVGRRSDIRAVDGVDDCVGDLFRRRCSADVGRQDARIKRADASASPR